MGRKLVCVKSRPLAVFVALASLSSGLAPAACGSSASDGSGDIPIVVDDAADTGEQAGDTAVADTRAADATDATDARDAGADTHVAETIGDGALLDAPRDTPAPGRCTGVATASFEPPTVCDGASGATSKQIPANHVYASSWFGCYRKTDGTIYKDPSDNCLFACGNKGLCSASLSGPQCEATLEWFAADADRYGCGGRIRVTNCVNGRSVILVTLDRGPNCKTVEQPYGAPALDMSHSAITYLFEGGTYGISDKKRVLVEAVADTTPLGPE